MFEIKVPPVGESVTYAELTNWLVDNGDYVEKDQDIAEFDSDKASFTLSAEETGKIKIIISPGKVNVGDVIAEIDTSAAGTGKEKTAARDISGTRPQNVTQPTAEVTRSESMEKTEARETKTFSIEPEIPEKSRISPLAGKIIEEEHIDVHEIAKEKPGRISKSDVEDFIRKREEHHSTTEKFSREISRKDLTSLRKKLADRLVQAKNQMAMLTTYNEVDLSRILNLRKEFGEIFMKKYGIRLGLMSFFAKASAIALRDFPEVNAYIEEDYIEYHKYVDLGIAVSTEKGLMVPVIRNAESLSLPELEIQIQTLAEKARSRKISIEEMTGGTFTITNGGVFGSLFSSPIINPPQSAILGMHKIQDRPVGIEGRIELRPMMYLALTYDHRIIDGKDSVSFLIRIRDLLMEPCKMALDGSGLDEALLGL